MHYDIEGIIIYELCNLTIYVFISFTLLLCDYGIMIVSLSLPILKLILNEAILIR